MLVYSIAVPFAFFIAQGFWTLIAYTLTWCGFPEAGAVLFRVALAVAYLGAISALAAFAWTQHRLNLLAVRQAPCRACTVMGSRENGNRNGRGC